jgi:hypothetical protein
MRPNFRISSLVPIGFAIESVSSGAETIIVRSSVEGGVAACPLCGCSSRSVHSRYVRQVRDLPCSGQSVCLRVMARWFFCGARDSPNGSLTTCARCGRVGRRGWNVSFIIWASRSAAGQRPVSRSD